MVKEMITYRTLTENEICHDLFRHFIRHQVVTKCWRRNNGEWVIRYDPFIDEWTEEEYQELIVDLQETLDLTNIHVSEDQRNCGIGKALFGAAKAWAKEHAAEKLYISAHSAVESQAFYRSMGCVEAKEYYREHVEKEPWDCQLECVL